MDPTNLTGRTPTHRMFELGTPLQARSGNQAADVRETFRYGNVMPARLDRRPGTYEPKAPRTSGGFLGAPAVSRVATKAHRGVLERFERGGAAGSRGTYHPKFSTGPKVPMGQTLAGGVMLTSRSVTGDLGPADWAAQVLRGQRERNADYMEHERRITLSGYGRFGGTTMRGFAPTLNRPGTRPKLGAYLRPGGSMPPLYGSPSVVGSMTITTPLPNPARHVIQSGSMSLAPFSFATASPSVGPGVIPLAAVAPAPGPAGGAELFSSADPRITSVEKGGSQYTVPQLPAPSAPAAPPVLDSAEPRSRLAPALMWSGLALIAVGAVCSRSRR